MSVALAFERVSKQYSGARRYSALRDDIVGAVTHTLHLKRSPRGVVKALDDVSFEIPEGQAFGLIGPNGAGKTTALKLATRITYPTDGVIRVRGRVGALIEVGTGMHPELTGRENIRLYGRILGLSGADINRRFDGIVEFAGVGSAIDQPVKQYSSGMQLRLGFSVAAHLEPNVFLVDEAIAVGDAGFQYRCVERMRELVRQGTTLVFVSHDMSAIETLCERAILLRGGKVAMVGNAREVVREYLLAAQAEWLATSSSEGSIDGADLVINRVSLRDASGNEVQSAQAGKTAVIRLEYYAKKRIRNPIFSIGLSDSRIGCFALASMLIDGAVPEAIDGQGHIDCVFQDLPLNPRVYEIWSSVRGESGYGDLVDWQRVGLFRVVEDAVAAGRSAVAHSMDDAPVRLPYKWRTASGNAEMHQIAVP